MPFKIIEDSFDVCNRYLSRMGIDDIGREEVESRIVGGLTVLIVSEYEALIEKCFIDRSNMCGDLHVSNYVRKIITDRFRSPDIGKITDILGKYGSDYRKTFERKIINTDVHAAWDNIMKARHYFVHKKGFQSMTIVELKASYDKTKILITKLRETLGITI